MLLQMENGLHGLLGQVVVLSVVEVPRAELEIVPIPHHQMEADIVLEPILIF